MNLENSKVVVDETMTNDDLLLFRIQKLSPQMSNNSKKISAFLDNNLEAFLNMSITQLSNKLKVSPSAITRYCQSFGYSGINEFKYDLKESHRYLMLHEEDSIANPVLIRTLLAKEYHKMVSSVINQLDPTALDKASDMILSAKHIFCFGRGGSYFMAQLAQTLFMQIGIPCYTFADPPLAINAATLMQPDDLAIGLSSSGTSQIVIDSLRRARENGAGTIGIASEKAPPLVENSDIVITYDYRKKGDIRYFHMLKAAELAVLGVLYDCVFEKSFQQRAERIYQAAESFFSDKA